MSRKDPAKLRLDIARGHWALGEYDESVSCLERAIGNLEDHNPMMVLVGTMLDDVAAGPVVERLIGVRDRILGMMEQEADFDVPEPLATPTMAKLLADQGHENQARAVAEDVLRRNPDDERARAVRDALDAPRNQNTQTVARLERWLAAAQRRRQGDLQP